jgi:hypothetical protein
MGTLHGCLRFWKVAYLHQYGADIPLIVLPGSPQRWHNAELLEDAQELLLSHGNLFPEQINLPKVKQLTEYGCGWWHPWCVLVA